MKTLRDYAGGAGQWGEGGMIVEALRRTQYVCCTAAEFGAGDHTSLINTWDLADDGVICRWAESDRMRYAILEARVETEDFAKNVYVTRDHVLDVDEWLDGWPVPEVLSIDIDGRDYAVFARMMMRPKVVVIEHNPTVPPEVRWVGHGERQGASALALVGLATNMGYCLVGATVANLIFVHDPDAAAHGEPAVGFSALETRLEVIFDRSQLNYVISDYDGNYEMTGPWAWGRGQETEGMLLG